MFPGRLLISSAGTLGTSTDYTLDGIRHVDPYDGWPLPLPFPDALAEFKTEIEAAFEPQKQEWIEKSGTLGVDGAAVIEAYNAEVDKLNAEMAEGKQ